ncbi:MAG TPA: hypothetical protein VF598_12805 [Hymenobacter sp.]
MATISAGLGLHGLLNLNTLQTTASITLSLALGRLLTNRGRRPAGTPR